MEEFEEIDPYTGNDPEKLKKLGYVQVGSFGWANGERTENVKETMGGLDFLWVETEHFRIGSSLGTYKLPNDRPERDRLKEEFKALKKKLKRFKAPKKKLDPWIRLHLYAQRAETLYAQYVKDFGLEEMAQDKENPYLGNPKKFLLLICERKSELGRYLRVYEKAENEYSFGTGKPNDGMIFALNMEVIKEAYKDHPDEPLDSILNARIHAGLARSFANGHRQKLFACPRWLSYAIAHKYARSVDPRYGPAGPGAQRADDKHWKWNERVASLADNDFFASTEDIFGWTFDSEMNERDHMVVHSKLEWLMTKAKGDLTTFYSDVVTAIPGMTAGSTEELQKRQTLALAANFDLDPAEFDKKWKKWAKDQ